MPFSHVVEDSEIFSWRGCHFTDNALGIFYNDYFLSSHARAMRGFFLSLHHEDLVGFLEVKHMKVWGYPKDCVPQEFLIFKLAHTQPPTIHQNDHLNVSTIYWL